MNGGAEAFTVQQACSVQQKRTALVAACGGQTVSDTLSVITRNPQEVDRGAFSVPEHHILQKDFSFFFFLNHNQTVQLFLKGRIPSTIYLFYLDKSR